MCTEHVPSKPGIPYDVTRIHASVATPVNRRARCAASAVGLHASSQRTVAFWIGSFNASGRPRIEPSILTNEEYWLASQNGWRS